jgi:hypothetical protein
MNGITSKTINHMDVGEFWKHNKPILEKLERQRMPFQSRMIYKDVSISHDKTTGTYMTQYDLVNFYDNRKNFLKILAEFGPDMMLDREEIVAGNSLSEATMTTISGNKVTSPGHIKWLRQMTKRLVAGDNLR